ncbi:MAG TPA: hypothetical protein VJQ47_08785 [Steroidobacteraceae bacterium]|nr:hypothetical protein [Steroidobacteraceae bacterium]
MLPEALPQQVQSLLRAYVYSYEHLAVLLWVQREPGREWSAQDLASNLQLLPQLVEAAAKDLAAAGLLVVEPPMDVPHYRYTAEGATAAGVITLALEYAENPARVIQFLNASAIERVRNSALRAFADAFVLNKRGRDNG